MAKNAVQNENQFSFREKNAKLTNENADIGQTFHWNPIDRNSMALTKKITFQM